LGVRAATPGPRGTDEGPGLTLPAPQVPDPGTAPPLRWGVISPGHIADQFTATAHRATVSRVVSVVSRSQQRAEAFAAKHGLERAFSSVADMLAAVVILAAYVASPRALPHALSRPLFEASVPATVEKACIIHAAQPRSLPGVAHETGVFATEAMRVPFLPQYGVL